MNAANFTPKQIAIAGISAFVLLLGTQVALLMRLTAKTREPLARKSAPSGSLQANTPSPLLLMTSRKRSAK